MNRVTCAVWRRLLVTDPGGCTLTLPYPPSVNHLYRRTRGGRVVLTEAGAQYKHDAGMTALAAGIAPFTGPLVVSITVYRPRRSGDLDNTLKALLDAGNGVLWLDDQQIVELHAFRRDDKHLPRAVVTVAAARP